MEVACPSRSIALMAGAVRPHVPKVDLLNPSVEPTDEELEALMLDFQRVVRERRTYDDLYSLLRQW